MTLATILFVSVSLLLFLAAFMTIRSARHPATRIGSALVYMALLGVFYVGFIASLSKPKPALFEEFGGLDDESVVLSAKIENEIAIYLWLQFEGTSEPRSFVFPWDADMAAELREAMREGQGKHRILMRGFGDNNRLDTQDYFRTEPVPTDPPKMDEPEVETYSHPSWNI